MRLLIALFAAFALAAPAVSQQAPPPPVDLTNPADGTTIRLKRGGELKLILDGAPVQQQQWNADPDVGPVLSPIGGKAVVPKSMNPLDLTAGQWNIFRYRAEQPGKVTLKLGLQRPGQAPEKTAKYEVIVE
ncbi:MAG: protease inhibitor I42 family protein [Burkholderiales bacterium]|nr:protease inhibitor I42 family protein [Burkholderiales bacterium]